MIPIIAGLLAVTSSTPALAQASPAGMSQTCSCDFTARTDTQQNRQHVHGTHAIRDRSFVKTRNKESNVVPGIEQT